LLAGRHPDTRRKQRLSLEDRMNTTRLIRSFDLPAYNPGKTPPVA